MRRTELFERLLIWALIASVPIIFILHLNKNEALNYWIGAILVLIFAEAWRRHSRERALYYETLIHQNDDET